MIRFLVGFTVCVVALVSLTSGADEPRPDQPDAPVRLKKKKPNVPPVGEKQPEDKQPEDKKPEEKKSEDKSPITRDGEPIDPEEDEKEVWERIVRNMKTVEDRLINKELNDGTRQMQADIVKDLDSLIRSAENPQGSDGGQGEQGNDNAQKGNKDQSNPQQGNKGNGKKPKGQAGSKGNPKNQQSSKNKQPGQGQGQDKQRPSNAAPMGQDNEKNQGQKSTNPGTGSNKDQAGDPNKDAELFKDTWGHLPETLRAQMNAYSSREKYMDKHHDLIKQYYKTIAAQGQRKKE